MKKIRQLNVLICCLAIMELLFPANCMALADIGTYSFLRNSPAELFGDQDWALFEGKLIQALNDNKEGVVYTWENPKSQYSGEITVIKTVSQGARECRAVKVVSQASDRSRTSIQIFCKADGGDWKLAPQPYK